MGQEIMKILHHSDCLQHTANLLTEMTRLYEIYVTRYYSERESIILTKTMFQNIRMCVCVFVQQISLG